MGKANDYGNLTLTRAAHREDKVQVGRREGKIQASKDAAMACVMGGWISREEHLFLCGNTIERQYSNARISSKFRKKSRRELCLWNERKYLRWELLARHVMPTEALWGSDGSLKPQINRLQKFSHTSNNFTFSFFFFSSDCLHSVTLCLEI